MTNIFRFKLRSSKGLISIYILCRKYNLVFRIYDKNKDGFITRKGEEKKKIFLMTQLCTRIPECEQKVVSQTD